MPSEPSNPVSSGRVSSHTPTGRSLATQATPSGRGSIATLMLAGVDIVQQLKRHFRPASNKPPTASNTVYFGHWNHQAIWHETNTPGRNEAWEEVVVTVSEQNAPWGMETIVEIQCHGGNRAARSILNSLQAQGFQVVSWTDWLRRDRSVFEQEIAKALAAAATRQTALLLLAQASIGDGALRREIDEIVAFIADPSDAGHALAGERISKLIQTAPVGCHLSEPWQVAVVGAPNVGKSSLVNALVGYQRAIVYDQPGTTRDELATLTALDGWPVRLWDTAGLRHTADEIERLGISRAAARLADAELLIHVCDARFEEQQPTVSADSSDLLNQIKQHHNVLIVRNKIDLAWDPKTLSEDAIATSALTGVGLPTLKERIITALIPDPPHHNTPLLFTRRQTELAFRALSALEQKDAHSACVALNNIIR